jgi:hypothetical protein
MVDTSAGSQDPQAVLGPHELRFKGMPNDCGKSTNLLELGRFVK